MKAHFERTPKHGSSSRQPSGAAAQVQTGLAGASGQVRAGKAGTSRQTAAPALPKVALLWGLAPDHPALAPLRAAGRLGLALRTVAPRELNATVGALCGIPAAAEGRHAGGAPTKTAGTPAKPDGPIAGALAKLVGPAASAGPDIPAMPGGPVPVPPAPKGPALVLCGLPGPEREALLDALRTAGAAIPLKAIVTPTNQNWRFGQLLAELAREHAALHGGTKSKE